MYKRQVLVGREAGSGTRDGVESIVDVKDSCKYAQELTATGAVISAVEANPLDVYKRQRPASPALKKLIAMVVDAARKADIPVTICGLAVGNAVNATQYLRLGLRSFSMSPQNLLTIKKALRDADAR